ncbi:thioredoxin family protein [Pseudenhygromyxa sp. WMMC2535]|uniref:thioredoxin family protein n=1 Tax=Pseudenhygromyxa sp. WMMC2535 TaxID=2712867 RepID=UPI0015533368|nr:thioredoxin family protein [Pseudenhygromyxa sp. WMMC2535]NVB38170.1 thioredoxin family protein [Pseudenhygromyxa sp. WMMC2535]
MALTPSRMIPLGTEAPAFELPDPNGQRVSLDALCEASKGVLVVFMCNHCPYVKHLADALAKLGRELPVRGVAMVGINSNDFETYPADNPAAMAAEIEARGYTFPYLVDEDQSVARAYQAACTPDFFLFDGRRRLVYRGELDDSRPGNGLPVTGASLGAAVDAMLAGEPVAEEQIPSMGCNIKWR